MIQLEKATALDNNGASKGNASAMREQAFAHGRYHAIFEGYKPQHEAEYLREFPRLQALRAERDRLVRSHTVESGFEFDEVAPEHHEALLMWMKHRAYGKQDAETFDRGRSLDYKQQFANYCAAATAEWDRYKSNTNPVAYGGL